MSEKKLNELKERVAELQEEIRELTPEELEQVFGGGAHVIPPIVENTTVEGLCSFKL